MTGKFIKIYGWLTNSPSQRSWFELDPYYSPFGKDETIVEIPKGHELKSPASGWCSWYAFGDKINEEIILKQAEWFARNRDKVPIEYIQIDDGWAVWGDWEKANPEKFPNGLRHTVTEIKKMGFKAGIWLSPFLLDLRSKVALMHPDWIMKDSKGRPVYGHAASELVPDFLWRKRYVLNTHVPEAYKYVLDCIANLVENDGFDLLKIDFMNGVYYDPSLRNADHADNIVHAFLSYIKNCYPNVYTLTGISPISPAAGMTDAIRISDDIIFPSLRGKWPINWIIHTERLRQLEENLRARKELAKVWSLDPDAFVCGEDVGLTDGQIRKLSQLHREAKGVRFLGDDMTVLSKERLEKYVYPMFS